MSVPLPVISDQARARAKVDEPCNTDEFDTGTTCGETGETTVELWWNCGDALGSAGVPPTQTMHVEMPNDQMTLKTI